MMLAQLYSFLNPILYCYRDRRFRDAILEMLKMKKPAASGQRNNRRIGFAQSLHNLQRLDVLPRSKTLENLASNDDGMADGQVRLERRMSFSTPSSNRKSVHDHQPRITIIAVQGIQDESGATVIWRKSHTQATNHLQV